MKKIKILVKVVTFTLLMLITGCATENDIIVKPDTKVSVAKVEKTKPEKVQVKTNPGALLPPVRKDAKEVLHFFTFKSDPPGAGIYVIDTTSGKEVGFLGTTPVRILILKKNVEIDGFKILCTNLAANVAGMAVVGKTGKVEQIEYQFKFKMQGYYDEMKIEKLPLNTAENTEGTCSISLSSTNGGKR